MSVITVEGWHKQPKGDKQAEPTAWAAKGSGKESTVLGDSAISFRQDGADHPHQDQAVSGIKEHPMILGAWGR